MNNFEPSLNKISRQKKPSLILGDINIDLANVSVNKLTGEYLNLMLTNNFTPKIILPTRITFKVYNNLEPEF